MIGPFTLERRIFRPANGWLRVRRFEDLIAFTLCLAVIFMGAMLLAQALDQYNRAQTMAAWPTALGRIVQVGIEPVADEGELRWRPTVRYVFDVNGQTVMSSGLSPTTARESYSEADARHIWRPRPHPTRALRSLAGGGRGRLCGNLHTR